MSMASFEWFLHPNDKRMAIVEVFKIETSVDDSLVLGMRGYQALSALHHFFKGVLQQPSDSAELTRRRFVAPQLVAGLRIRGTAAALALSVPASTTGLQSGKLPDLAKGFLDLFEPLN